MRAASLSLWLVIGLTGCLGTSPEADAADALGDDGDEDEGPLHRPGQPCLACHGEDYTPGEEVFVVAGTVYGRPDDTVGIEDAQVFILDDRDRELVARTNRAGNFMVRVDGDLREPRQRSHGQLDSPFSPTFPLRIRVRMGDQEQLMRSLAHREGSCAECHRPRPGAQSAGPVYVFDEGT